MSIYDDLITAMEPGLDADEVVIGAFITAVSTGSQCGLSTLQTNPIEEFRLPAEGP